MKCILEIVLKSHMEFEKIHTYSDGNVLQRHTSQLNNDNKASQSFVNIIGVYFPNKRKHCLF